MNSPIVQPEQTQQQAFAFLLRLGRALHLYSYSTGIMEDRMQSVAERLKVQAQFFFTPTVIMAALGPVEQQRSFMLRVSPGTVDLSKLVEVERVAERVMRGEVSPGEGSVLLETVIMRKPLYHPLLRILAFGSSSAAFGRFIGGGVPELVTALIVGSTVGLLDFGAERGVGLLRRNFALIAAFTASLCAAAIGDFWGGSSIFVATLAGSVALLPGLAVTVSMSELSSGHLLAGTARLSGAVVVLVSIIFGNALGTTIAQLALGTVRSSEPRTLAPWTIWLALLVASLAFTVIFRAHRKDTFAILAVSLITFFVQSATQSKLGPPLAAFVAAFATTVASIVYGRLARKSPVVTLVPSILVLVPGSIGYRGLVALMQREFAVGLEGAFTMVLVAVAIAGGIIVAFELAPQERRAA